MASNYIVFIGWDRGVAGREANAIELFAEFSTYLTRMQNERTIERFDSYVLDPHATDLNGCMIIQGDVDKLSEVTRTNEWRDFQTKAAYQLQNLRVVRGVTGDEVRNQFARLQKLL